jgi:hydrogenase expression/formation protein HypC
LLSRVSGANIARSGVWMLGAAWAIAPPTRTKTMCLGVPMCIIEGDEMSALCVRGDEQRRVSLLLIGPQPVGTQVLVHIDTAVRLLEADEAALIDRALDGLAAAMRGEDFESAFADLLNREPQLPEHLRQR